MEKSGRRGPSVRGPVGCEDVDGLVAQVIDVGHEGCDVARVELFLVLDEETDHGAPEGAVARDFCEAGLEEEMGEFFGAA